MSDYQTPHKDGEVEKSLDEEEDSNDRENAEEFYILMKEKGHSFKTCEGKLLWYDPANGVYDEESDKLKLKLVNLFATSPVVAEGGRQTKNIWLAEERTTENNKNTLNAPCRKYVETI